MDTNRLLERTRTQLTNGPDTPAWWPLVQIALGVAFAITLLVSLGGSDAPAPTAGSQFGQVPQGAPTAAPTAAPTVGATADAQPPATTRPTPDADPPADTVEVPDADGSGMLAVPAAAKSTADAIATATFTGDFSRVPFVPGTTAPPAGATWDTPVLAAVEVRQLRDDLLQFVFTVDPDGDGPEAARRTTVHVADVNGTWAFRGV